MYGDIWDTLYSIKWQNFITWSIFSGCHTYIRHICWHLQLKKWWTCHFRATSGKYSSSVSSLLRENSTKHLLGQLTNCIRYLAPVLYRTLHRVVKAKFFFYPRREESLLIAKKVREDHVYREKTPTNISISHLLCTGMLCITQRCLP